MLAGRVSAMWLVGRMCLFSLLLSFAVVADAAPEKRVALVIGNASYENVTRLENAIGDAEAMARKLESLGFVVQQLENLTKADLDMALGRFRKVAQSADVALVYFAGHGMGIDKRNFLIPIDAKLDHEDDVEFEAISLDLVLRAVSGSSNMRLVILDSCRNNPFVNRMKRQSATRSISRGLSLVEPKQGDTLVWYAAKDGSTAEDGDGQHSPFTSALLEYIGQPGMEVGMLFRTVREAVLNNTGNRQEPYQYGSRGTRNFYFSGSGATPGNGNLQMASKTPTPPPVPQISPEEKMKREVKRFLMGNWLSGNNGSPRQLDAMYANRVFFFGTPTAKSSLVQEKVKYFNRWPVRNYQLIDNKLQVYGDPSGQTVDVSFEYTYDYQGNGRTAGGRAIAEISLSKVNGRFVVTREDGRVLQRY